MKAIERAGFLAHAKTRGFRHRLALATECIEEALALSERPCLSFSLGKDSSAMLWLVAQQKPDISVRTLSSGESRLLHGNFDEILTWWKERFPLIDYEEVLMDRIFTEEWKGATFDEQRKAGKGDIRREIPKTGNFDGWFIGLRSNESGWRKFWNDRKIPGTKHSIYQYKSGPSYRKGTYRFCPMAKWTEWDVGAMIATYDIPLPPSYTTLGMEHRTTLRLTNDAMAMGAVAELRDRDPDSYCMLIERFPELRRWG